MRIVESFSAYASISGSTTRPSGGVPPFSQTLETLSKNLLPYQAPSSLSSSLWASKDAVQPAQRPDSPAVRAFLGFSAMTLDQWIRMQILQQKNLTEEGLAALPVAEKEAVEREIAEAIKQALTGISKENAPDEAQNDLRQANDGISQPEETSAT